MTNNIIISLTIINTLLIFYILVSDKLKELHNKKKVNVNISAISTLAEQKEKDDQQIEQTKEMTQIDEYMNYLRDFIEVSRSKKRLNSIDKQNILCRTVQAVPLFSKYIEIDAFFNVEEIPQKPKEKDLLNMLESSYNDFTKDNLEGFNMILSIVMILRGI
jgi:hypothetical protein